MTLHCEAAGDDALAARIAETLQSVCKLRGEVAFADPRLAARRRQADRGPARRLTRFRRGPPRNPSIR